MIAYAAVDRVRLRNRPSTTNQLTLDPLNARGLLIRGRFGSGCIVGSKSAIDGSGVESLKELMYRASAISRFSKMASRSSIKTARYSVSLMEVSRLTCDENDVPSPDRKKALNVHLGSFILLVERIFVAGCLTLPSIPTATTTPTILIQR